jgi:hypothetical protein
VRATADERLEPAAYQGAGCAPRRNVTASRSWEGGGGGKEGWYEASYIPSGRGRGKIPLSERGEGEVVNWHWPCTSSIVH